MFEPSVARDRPTPAGKIGVLEYLFKAAWARQGGHRLRPVARAGNKQSVAARKVHAVYAHDAFAVLPAVIDTVKIAAVGADGDRIVPRADDFVRNGPEQRQCIH